MDPGDHLQAADARHFEIHHHHARLELGHTFEALGPIIEGHHAQTHLGQDLAAGEPHRVVVVDDDDHVRRRRGSHFA